MKLKTPHPEYFLSDFLQCEGDYYLFFNVFYKPEWHRLRSDNEGGNSLRVHYCHQHDCMNIAQNLIENHTIVTQLVSECNTLI